jgi:plastocyanin
MDNNTVNTGGTGNSASNNTMKIILVLVILAVIIGAVVLLMNMGNQAANNANNTGTNPDTTAPTSTVNNSANTQNETTTPSNNEGTTETTITYSGDSFSPSDVKVKAGSTVKVVNNSGDNLEFASDPHPVHTQNGELNVGSIAPGGSKTFTPTTKGSWGFHNHEKSSVTGKLTVE